MAKFDGTTAFWAVGITLGVLFLLSQSGFFGGTPGATPPGTTTSPQTGATIPAQCAVAPTVDLGANNKYESGQQNWANWKYKLNGGTTKTDADGNFEVGIDSELEVLVADGNSSSFYRAKWSPPITRCGVNSEGFNDVVEFTQYATKCFDEDNDPMNGTRFPGKYLTIGSAGSRSVDCEIEGVSKKGMPYGGMMILEFNQTTYKREDMTALTLGGAWASQKVSPESSLTGAYSVGVAGGTTRSFAVPPIVETGTYKFSLSTIQAKQDIDPGRGSDNTSTTYGDGIFGFIYPINCYEEEDVTPSEFRCGLSDIDDTFTSPGGTAKANGAVTQFIVNVD